MDFDLTEEQLMTRNLARDVAQREILPAALECDRTGRFPREVLGKLAPLGFLSPPLPQTYGGMGAGFMSYGLITEEVGAVDFAMTTTLNVHIALTQLTILNWGTEEQKQGLLPRMARGEIMACFGLTEPNIGSDVANLETRAERSGDEWVLNGAKMWISNGGVADVAIVFAQTDPSQGHRGIGAFLVERGTPGFTSRDITNKMGIRSSNTAELSFADCRIPGDSMLGRVGQGMRIALGALDYGRYHTAAGCVGVAQACLDHAVQYAKGRIQFKRPIAGFQLIQDLIADMAVETEAARYLYYRVGDLMDKGKPFIKEVSIAKYFASEVAFRTAHRAMQVFGGYGFSEDFPIARHFRDVRAAALYEGTSQIQKLIIGREILGENAITP